MGGTWALLRCAGHSAMAGVEWGWAQCDGDGFTAGILLSLTKTIFRSTPLACYLITRIYRRCQECIGLADPLAIQDTHQLVNWE